MQRYNYITGWKAGLTKGPGHASQPAMEGEWEEEEFERLYEEEMAMMREQAGIVLCLIQVACGNLNPQHLWLLLEELGQPKR